VDLDKVSWNFGPCRIFPVFWVCPGNNDFDNDFLVLGSRYWSVDDFDGFDRALNNYLSGHIGEYIRGKVEVMRGVCSSVASLLAGNIVVSCL
jgi:hypothetical protein